MVLQNDKQHTIDDQRRRYHIAVIKVGIHPVIQQKSKHRRWYTGYNDLQPESYSSHLLRPALSRIKWIQSPEIQHNNRQNGT